jgi:integrase
MSASTAMTPTQATKLAKGTEIKTAKPGSKLRFGNGLYLLVSANGTKSWQVHYHVAGRHQATIVGRWPEVSVEEAKAKREAIRQTVHAGGDPAKERHEKRAARQDADAATVRVVADAWIETASKRVPWSEPYARAVKGRMAAYVYPAIGERAIGRIGTHDVEAIVLHGVVNAEGQYLRAQAVHVRLNLQKLFDYALRRKLVAENPVRIIAEDLPRWTIGGEDSEEQCRAFAATIEEARTVLRAVESSRSPVFEKLLHRLIALTAVRKMEAIGAQWSEVSESADGWTWTIPAVRMKGRKNKKHSHIVPLSPQAVEVLLAARALAAALGIKSGAVFPGHSRSGGLARNGLNKVVRRTIARVGLAGRHTIHGWRSTMTTLLIERDFRDERAIDAMLAHKPIGVSRAQKHYDHAVLLPVRRRLACVWADMLLLGAPSAFALVGMVEPSNVVQLREAA